VVLSPEHAQRGQRLLIGQSCTVGTLSIFHFQPVNHRLGAPVPIRVGRAVIVLGLEVCSNRVTDVQELSVVVSLSVSNSRGIRRVSLQNPHELVLQCRLKGTLPVY
jgi:hypothetical protein